MKQNLQIKHFRHFRHHSNFLSFFCLLILLGAIGAAVYYYYNYNKTSNNNASDEIDNINSLQDSLNNAGKLVSSLEKEKNDKCKKLNIPLQDCNPNVINWCDDPDNQEIMKQYALYNSKTKECTLAIKLGLTKLQLQIQDRFNALVKELQEAVQIDNRLQFSNIRVSVTDYDAGWGKNWTEYYQASKLYVNNPNGGRKYICNAEGCLKEGKSGSTTISGPMTFAQFKNFLINGSIANESANFGITHMQITAKIKALQIKYLKPLDIGKVINAIKNSTEYTKNSTVMDAMLKDFFIDWEMVNTRSYSYNPKGYRQGKTIGFSRYGFWEATRNGLCNLSNVESFKDKPYNSAGDTLQIKLLPC